MPTSRMLALFAAISLILQSSLNEGFSSAMVLTTRAMGFLLYFYAMGFSSTSRNG